MMDLASPMSAFVRDCCARKPDASVSVDDLYSAWKAWAEDNGHQAGAKSTFGRNLRAVVPDVKISQPTINGKRVKSYVHIGLLPVHPVHDQTALVCTGCGAAPDDRNPLVNGLCTGCTGKGPLWAQEDQRSGEVRRCPCGNKLVTIDAINSGKCKPCRNKRMAGYDQMTAVRVPTSRRRPRRHLRLRPDDRRTPQGVGAQLRSDRGIRIGASG